MRFFRHITMVCFCILTLAGCKNEEDFDWRTLNERWMEANAQHYQGNPNFHVTSSGLQYYIEYIGDSAASHPNSSSTVYVQYKGKLIDGHEFDSSTGTSFTVSATVSGFAEGLRKMYPGGRAVLFIPQDLGYGKDGSGTKGYDSYIPPYSALVFEVTLMGRDN